MSSIITCIFSGTTSLTALVQSRFLAIGDPPSPFYPLSTLGGGSGFSPCGGQWQWGSGGDEDGGGVAPLCAHRLPPPSSLPPLWPCPAVTGGWGSSPHPITGGLSPPPPPCTFFNRRKNTAPPPIPSRADLAFIVEINKRMWGGGLEAERDPILFMSGGEETF